VNPSSGGRVVPYGQTDTDRETERHDAGSNSRFLVLRTHLRTRYVRVSFCLCAPIEYGIFIVKYCTAGGRHCLKQPVVVKQLRNCVVQLILQLRHMPTERYILAPFIFSPVFKDRFKFMACIIS